MTKCRLNVHVGVHAKGSSDTPAVQHCWPSPHLTQRGCQIDRFLGILNEPVSIRKLGTLRVPTVYKDEVVKKGPKFSKTGPRISKTVLNSVKRVLESVKQVLNSVKLRLKRP